VMHEVEKSQRPKLLDTLLIFTSSTNKFSNEQFKFDRSNEWMFVG
jgi:hypothetical protein